MKKTCYLFLLFCGFCPLVQAQQILPALRAVPENAEKSIVDRYAFTVENRRFYSETGFLRNPVTQEIFAAGYANDGLAFWIGDETSNYRIQETNKVHNPKHIAPINDELFVITGSEGMGIFKYSDYSSDKGFKRRNGMRYRFKQSHYTPINESIYTILLDDSLKIVDMEIYDLDLNKKRYFYSDVPALSDVFATITNGYHAMVYEVSQRPEDHEFRKKAGTLKDTYYNKANHIAVDFTEIVGHQVKNFKGATYELNIEDIINTKCLSVMKQKKQNPQRIVFSPSQGGSVYEFDIHKQWKVLGVFPKTDGIITVPISFRYFSSADYTKNVYEYMEGILFIDIDINKSIDSKKIALVGFTEFFPDPPRKEYSQISDQSKNEMPYAPDYHVAKSGENVFTVIGPNHTMYIIKDLDILTDQDGMQGVNKYASAFYPYNFYNAMRDQRLTSPYLYKGCFVDETFEKASNLEASPVKFYYRETGAQDKVILYHINNDK